jgi:cell division protein ZapA
MGAVTVRIHGEEYSIRSQDDPAYVHRVADFVDARIRETAAASKVLSPSRVAVLTALNIADELIRLKESAERDRENVETVLGELSRILEEAMQG